MQNPRDVLVGPQLGDILFGRLDRHSFLSRTHLDRKHMTGLDLSVLAIPGNLEIGVADITDDDDGGLTVETAEGINERGSCQLFGTPCLRGRATFLFVFGMLDDKRDIHVRPLIHSNLGVTCGAEQESHHNWCGNFQGI